MTDPRVPNADPSDVGRRLDVELVERGLVGSRTSAARLVRSGDVRVDGVVVKRPAVPVPAGAEVSVDDPGWVSRGALKLEAALAAFGIDVQGRLALDAGASTGGFTQVLLRRGAARVLAVDVGHDQMHPLVATDPRVVALEGVNVRDLTPATLAELSGVDAVPGMLVADLSFISLPRVLPALVGLAAADADLVLLVKPQFEVGRALVHGGVVRDPALRASAVRGVLAAAAGLGVGTAGILMSPLTGEMGNREVLVHLSRTHGTDPTQWEPRLADLARDA